MSTARAAIVHAKRAVLLDPGQQRGVGIPVPLDARVRSAQ